MKAQWTIPAAGKLVLAMTATMAFSVAIGGCAKSTPAVQAPLAPPREAPSAPPPPPPVEKPAAEAAASTKSEAPAVDNSSAASIYFDFDSAELTEAAMATLQKWAEDLKGPGKKALRIEGNCDERGTAEYNLALGAHRAEAARRYLGRLGVPAKRVSTVSYGSERPTAQGHDESAWSQNRRDDFQVR